MENDASNPYERKVICQDNEDSTWSFNDNASQFLEVGKIYTVTGIEFHSWHTRFTLAEIPNRQFNSVHFREVDSE